MSGTTERATERAALYGSVSSVSAILGTKGIGVATGSLGMKTLAILGIASNPITAAIAGGIVVAGAVYALTKLEN